MGPGFLALFDLVSALYAGCHARHGRLQLIDEFEPLEGSDRERFLDSEQQVDRVDGWAQSLWEGRSPFESWEDENDPLLYAVDMAERLSVDLEDHGEMVEQLLANATEEFDPDVALELIAALQRNARANRGHLRVSIEFARLTGREESAQRYESVLPYIESLLEETECDLDALRADAIDELRWHRLQVRAAAMPGIFRGMRCDLQHLIANATDDAHLGRYDLDTYEWSRWDDAGFDVFDAGAWKAFGFNIVAAVEWCEGANGDPRIANEWSCRDFDVEEAASWSEVGVLPEDARCWLDELGAGPGEVAAWRQYGCDLPRASRWATLDLDVEGARAWSRAGVSDPTDVQIYLGCGIETPQELTAWRAAGIESLTVIRLWRGIGAEPEDLATLQQVGIEPDEIRAWSEHGFTRDTLMHWRVEMGIEEPREALIWRCARHSLGEDWEKYYRSGITAEQAVLQADRGA